MTKDRDRRPRGEPLMQNAAWQTMRMETSQDIGIHIRPAGFHSMNRAMSRATNHAIGSAGPGLPSAVQNHRLMPLFNQFRQTRERRLPVRSARPSAHGIGDHCRHARMIGICLEPNKIRTRFLTWLLGSPQKRRRRILPRMRQRLVWSTVAGSNPYFSSGRLMIGLKASGLTPDSPGGTLPRSAASLRGYRAVAGRNSALQAGGNQWVGPRTPSPVRPDCFFGAVPVRSSPGQDLLLTTYRQ